MENNGNYRWTPPGGNKPKPDGKKIRNIILLGLLGLLVIMLLTGLNPLDVYFKMIDGNFSTSRRLWMLLQIR